MRRPIDLTLVLHAGEEVGLVREVAGREHAYEVGPNGQQRSVVADVGKERGRRGSSILAGEQSTRHGKDGRVQIIGESETVFPWPVDNSLEEKPRDTHRMTRNSTIPR